MDNDFFSSEDPFIEGLPVSMPDTRRYAVSIDPERPWQTGVVWAVCRLSTSDVTVSYQDAADELHRGIHSIPKAELNNLLLSIDIIKENIIKHLSKEDVNK